MSDTSTINLDDVEPEQSFEVPVVVTEDIVGMLFIAAHEAIDGDTYRALRQLAKEIRRGIDREESK